MAIVIVYFLLADAASVHVYPVTVTVELAHLEKNIWYGTGLTPHLLLKSRNFLFLQNIVHLKSESQGGVQNGPKCIPLIYKCYTE